MDGWMDGLMMSEWMGGKVHGSMDGWACGWMDLLYIGG